MSLIKVFKEGVEEPLHQVETTAVSIFMRGDGWMDLGTFRTDVEPEPQPEPEPEPQPEPEPVEGMGPLVVSSANPRYFAKPDGTPIYLTGSHTWNNLVDSSQPGTFDFAAYLDWMVANKFNFIRLWAGLGAPWGEIGPSPYQRTGPGTAHDGALKYDLSRFNQAYFDRMRSRCAAAAAKGIYVDVMMWNDWSIRGKDGGHFPWPDHPFNAANNINGINGDPAGTGDGGAVSTLAVPAVTALQKAFIEKVIDTVGDLDNVLYEITNESHGGSENTAWQNAMIAHLNAHQATKPKRHPVGFTFQWPGGSNASLFASDADWVSPNGDGGYMNDPPAADGSKVVIVDTDHVFGLGGDAVFIWKQFLRGNSAIVMDNMVGTGVAGDWPEINAFDTSSSRRGMTQTAEYAARLELANAPPQNALSSTGYCLAQTGVSYLAYTTGPFTMNLSGATTTFNVEWLNIDSGAVTPGGTVSGGAVAQSFTPPAGGAHVLYLSTTGEPIPEPEPEPEPPVLTDGTFGSPTKSAVVTVDSGAIVGVSAVDITHPEGGGTPGVGPFYKPTSVQDLKNALQAALDEHRMLFLYPDRYDIDMPLDLTVRPQSEWVDGSPPNDVPNRKAEGLWGYGSQFDWKLSGGRMMTFDCPDGENGSLRILGLSMYGRGFHGQHADELIRLRGYSGSAIRNALVKDITMFSALVGIALVGEVFESWLDYISGAWMATAGITCVHSGSEVLSNIFINNPSFRTSGAGGGKGIWCKGSANSVLIDKGNFISLTGPAIHGESGVKRISFCSFENAGNAGHAAVQIDADTFGTSFICNDGSNTGGSMTRLLDYRAPDSKLVLLDGSRFNCSLR